MNKIFCTSSTMKNENFIMLFMHEQFLYKIFLFESRQNITNDGIINIYADILLLFLVDLKLNN